MRVAFVHWGVPRPSDGSQRSWRAAKWLAERHDVTLVPLGEAAPEDVERARAANMHVEDVVSVPTFRGFESAMGRVFPARLGDAWSQSGQEIQKKCRGSNWVYGGWWGLPAIWNTRGETKRTFTWDWDALSLWHLSAAAWLARREPIRAGLRLINAGSFRVMEHRHLGKMDLVTTPSEREKAWFENHLKVRSLWVRNCVDVDHFGMVDPRLNDPQPTIGFMGSLDYPPNRDGLIWFIKRVWPKVLRHSPASKLFVAGRGVGNYLEDLLSKYPRIEIRRNVPDARDLYQSARVVVVPIWYGGGIPYKILEAGASARAVVTTPYVAKAAGDSVGILPVGKSSREFTELVVKYLKERQAASEKGEELRNWIRATYSVERWKDDMEILSRWVQSAGGLAS